MKRKPLEMVKTEDEIQAAVNKKSFELNYNGGNIWCEHLDGMGNLEQKVIEKFYGDFPKMLRPSVSSFVIINIDGTVITEAIKNAIINGLTDGTKQFRRIAFVGLDRKHHKQFDEIHKRNGTIVKFWDDYEKAKEWVMQIKMEGILC